MNDYEAMKKAFNDRWAGMFEPSKTPWDIPMIENARNEFRAGWRAAIKFSEKKS